MKFQNPSTGYHAEPNYLKKCSSCFNIFPKDTKVCPYCGKRQGWNWTWPAILALVVSGVCLLGSIGYLNINAKDTIITAGTDEGEIQRLLSQICLPKDLEIIKFNWRKDGFGTVAMIDNITIKNRGKTGCRDINGIMYFYAKSGTELGNRLFVIYDKIPTGKTKTFRDINIGFLPSNQISNAGVVILGGMSY